MESTKRKQSSTLDQSENPSKSKSRKELPKSQWNENLSSVFNPSSRKQSEKDKTDFINVLLDVCEKLYIKSSKEAADAVEFMVKGGQASVSTKKVPKKRDENQDENKDGDMKGIVFEASRKSILDSLTNSCRRRNPLERWSPYEIAVFEAAICHHGKNFHKIQKHLEHKTTGDVIDFYYYVWKHSNRYKAWKEKRDFIDTCNFHESGD
eukprot:GDKK01036812.1.p1 GENE.GDKK01036812.1~~GDKK01036812.1.p1  ORF type:complete len:208 (-),score=32.50 GDKK01036812.1:307-930(-)